MVGWGNGRGLGLGSDLLGAAAKPPLNLRLPDSPSKASCVVLPLSLAMLLAATLGVVEGWLEAPASGVVWEKAEGRVGLGCFGGDADLRLSRISGLNRDMLAFVGDANEGRLRRGEDWGVCCVGASSEEARCDSLGDVRRRLGADSSISLSIFGSNRIKGVP